MKLFLLALFFLGHGWCFANVPMVEDLFDRIGKENVEVQGADVQVRFSEQNLVGARSRLYPSLSLSFTANEGEDGATPSSADVDSGSSSPGSGLGSKSTGITDLPTGRGWVSQLSTGYYLFSQFAIDDLIFRSQNELKNTKLSHSLVYDQKKSQLLQLLLEWQTLNKVREPLIKASSLIEKVKTFASGRSRLLYTARDRANLAEKSASLEYNKVKVIEGLRLVESAIFTLVPSLKAEELKMLKPISVTYEIPQFDELRGLYKNSSRSNMMASNDLAAAKNYRDSTSWNKPWIPNIYWSASYSYSGDYTGRESNNGASTSILFSFGLFDGFYSQARAEQSEIGVEGAQRKIQLEEDRRVLLLKHKRMKSVVSRAEYTHKKAVARKKYLRYRDIQRKLKLGIGTKLEMSVGTLDWVKAQIEALDSLKEYQQALLDVAVELNQWDKVEINEDNS